MSTVSANGYYEQQVGVKRKIEEPQEYELVQKKPKRVGRPPNQVEPLVGDVFLRAERIAKDPKYNVDDDGNELQELPPPGSALESDGITVNPNENYLQRREGRTDLEFRFLNFRNHKDQELLTDVKGLVIKQLPNMPPDYVIKIVYNIEFHETLAAISKITGQLLGIICYRKFEEHHFIEIVFCAVLSTAQFGGIGKSLMTRLKDKLLMEQYYHLITCADVEATGYFEKMGFSKNITFDPNIWKPRIKDYVSTVLMHCEMVPKYPVYKNGTTVLKAQYIAATEIMESHKIVHRCSKVALFRNGSRVPVDQLPDISDRLRERLSKLKPSNETEEMVRKGLDSLALVYDESSNNTSKTYCEFIFKKSRRHKYLTINMFNADIIRMFQECSVSPHSKDRQAAKALVKYFKFLTEYVQDPYFFS